MFIMPNIYLKNIHILLSRIIQILSPSADIYKFYIYIAYKTLQDQSGNSNATLIIIQIWNPIIISCGRPKRNK